jgi:hypothetical protein
MSDTTLITQNPRDTIVTLLGDYPYKIARNLPEITADIEEIESCGIFDKLTSKEEYLAWVRLYKSTIAQSEAHLRELKSLRKTGTIWEKAGRMETQQSLAKAVTTAIHMRRLGKIWSASQKRQIEKAA